MHQHHHKHTNFGCNVSIAHYDNTPMQYTAIFTAAKNYNFQLEKKEYFSYFY